MTDQVIVITPEPAIEIVELPRPSLPFLQERCGGLVDVIRMAPPDTEVPYDVWVNDEFLFNGSEPNHVATLATGREIHGTVVFADVNANGDTVGAPRELIEVCARLKELLETERGKA